MGVKPELNVRVARIGGYAALGSDVARGVADGIISVAEALVRPRSDWSPDDSCIAALWRG